MKNSTRLLLFLSISFLSLPGFTQTIHNMSAGIYNWNCSGTLIYLDACITTNTTVNYGTNWVPPSAPSNYNYQNNQSVTETINSTTGQCLTLTFNAFPSSWGLYNPGDTLFVYDGPSASGIPVATFYNLSGNPTTPAFTSTSPSVTFKFVSDNATNGKGWRIDITCVACPSPPGNDPCSGAQQLSPGASCVNTPGIINSVTNTTSGVPAPSGGSCAGATAGDDVWYYFIASQTTADITIAGTSPMRPVIQLLRLTSGTCTVSPVWSQIGCASAAAAGGSATINATGLTVGAVYYIRVFDYFGSTTSAFGFNICVVTASAQDCAGASLVCSTTSTSGSSTTIGFQEWASGTWGCLVGGEHRSSWYYFQAQTAGVFGFNVSSANSGSSQDVDFALWGPMSSKTCPLPAAPLRCSYAIPYMTNSYGMPNYSTGLQMAEADLTEGAGGNAFVQTINAVAGQWYILLIDIFSGYTTYNLTWNPNIPVASQATLWNCLLAIDLLTFSGENTGTDNVLHWTTAAETGNAYFTLERSPDGENFYEIGEVQGAGNSMVELNYIYYDHYPLKGMNYYRLKQTDYDGAFTYSYVISIENTLSSPIVPTVYPNPGTGVFTVDVTSENESDIIIEVYNSLGQLVVSNSNHINSGRNELILDISGYEHGVYTIHIRESQFGKIYTNRIVKL